MANLSIVIPVFNEASRLPVTIETLATFTRSQDEHLEIIFVDDGSTDGTAAILDRSAESRANWRVVSYQENAGKGYAVRRGILEAGGSRILISDADLSTPLTEVSTLLEHAGSFDVVIGSRAVDTSSVKLAQPGYRQSMGRTFNRLMRAITGLPFRDTQCGFKLFDAAAAKEIAHLAAVDRFAWDVEFLMLACKAGYSITEVPVLWFNSPESRVRIVRDSLRMLIDLIRLRLRLGKVSCDQSPEGTRR